jgi:hypothetical protein
MSADAKVLAAALILIFGASLGCDVTELPEAPPTAPAAPAAQAVEESPKVATAGGTLVEDDAPPVSDTPRPFDVRDPIKGRASREAGGYLGAVGNSRFAAEYKIIMANITHALNLYWGSEGEYPQTHEEFMEKIIKFNNLKLPELPPDREYIYVPDEPKPENKLMVRRAQSPPGDVAETAPSSPPNAAPADATQPEAPAGELGDAAAEVEPEPSYSIRERAAALGGQAPEVEEP